MDYAVHRKHQDYLAEVLQNLNFVRLKSEPNVYTNATRDCYIVVYVDDLLVLGDKTAVDSTFEAVQKQVYSSTSATSNLANHNNFLEETDHFGNYCNLGLKDSYIDNMIEESGMNNCNSVNTPGIAHYKPTIEDEALLDHEQHKRYRRIVGKLQWLAYTRPDIAYSTKELARDLTAPTELSQKRVKHLLRYLHGTKHYKFTIEPTTTLRANTNNILDLDVHVDADWAGCPTTRKSTSGFNIIFLGTTVAFGSRTQATIALSSAESELYAICTGVNEGLHHRNFLLETNICSKLNLRIHTDSTAGKSIATRQGTSKRAKHIDIKFLYTQDLIKHDIIRILKINTLHNSADLFTKYISKETLHRLTQSTGIRI